MSVHKLHAMPCRTAPLLYAHRRLAKLNVEAQQSPEHNACAKSQKASLERAVRRSADGQMVRIHTVPLEPS